MKIRNLIKLAVAATAGLALAAPAAAEVDELKMMSQYGIGYMQLTVMKHDKLVEKHLAAAGLTNTKVSWTKLGAGAVANDALLSGTLHLAAGGTGPAIILWDKTKGRGDVHGVAEEITGVDLVAGQISSAAGERLRDILPREVEARGHAIEARVSAEDPQRFFPSTGTLAVFRPPRGEGIRVETGYGEGNVVTPFYDSLLAKVIACAPTREEAIDNLDQALAEFEISGVKTNIPAVRQVLGSEAFREGRVHTGLLQECLDTRKAARTATRPVTFRGPSGPGRADGASSDGET